MSAGRGIERLVGACAAIGVAAWLGVACEAKTEREPLPDWREGLSQGDAGVRPDAFVEPDAAVEDAGPQDAADPIEGFALTPAYGLGYDTRLSATRAVDGECAVNPDGTPQGFEEKECTLDINELDLYGNGLDFDFWVPEGVCEYVIYGHYMYEAFEVGVGPIEVSWDVDGVGNVSNQVNAVNGMPYCEYDHRWRDPDAPNCCLGSYTATITNTDSGQVEVQGPLFWGGKPAECYNGAAFWDPEASLSEDGWPMNKIVFTQELAWHKRFHWDNLSTDYFTNVVLASYYHPLDHQPGGAPAGLLAAWAQPFYTFQCYDHAEELLAELRLVVKEWNEEHEFYTEDDPDSTGIEPHTGTPINDRRDWADATPGSVDFIEFAQ